MGVISMFKSRRSADLEDSKEGNLAQDSYIKALSVYRESISGEAELHLFLTGEINAKIYSYDSWYQELLTRNPIDRIVLHINSPGGVVDDALQILSALKHARIEKSSHIHIRVEGLCGSASTIFLMLGDSFEVEIGSTFMFHDISTGLYGKTGGELLPFVEYQKKLGKELFDTFYAALLTSEEIQRIQTGQDIWFSASEMKPRLAKIVAAKQTLETINREAQEELEAALEAKTEALKAAVLKKARKALGDSCDIFLSTLR